MEENVEKIDAKKLRPLENFGEDFAEYAVNRLSLKEGEDDIELTKDSIYHALHLLWQFGSSDRDYRFLIGFLSNVYDFHEEFQKKFGERYDNACEDCREKLDKGEIKETPKNDCGGCN